MYKEVRTRLTALFASVTCVLLLALLIISFYLSAKSQYLLSLTSFTNHSAAITEELPLQNVLTAQWLSSREKAGSVSLFLMEQNIPMFHNSTHPQEITSLFEEVCACLSGETHLGRLLPDSGESNVYIYHKRLLPAAFLRTETIARGDSIIQIFIIESLDGFLSGLQRTILLYILLFIPAACFLAAFSWHFTGKLLRPLLDARESQNRFISAASHELRTPLAVILANASACEKAPASKQAPFFQVIEQEGAQMSGMLEQLLILSRADSHALTMQPAASDLQTLLLKIYESFRPLARSSGHSLLIGLPDEEIPVWRCDEPRIEQICAILLQNALAYTPSGSTLRLILSIDGKYAEISVQDNGPGIPDAEKELIFQRFSRGSSMAKQTGHHGLGLSVAAEIAAAHHGTLTVCDAPGGGALFTLRFPSLEDM